ncbi:hypothetical protein AAFF_G00119210 [Aldrovandia affinis]|uniref:G-protein coupled receptors family 1 profile domain-containing protein n=1 Tax=Aldrovandia affinis TaxID=143900 RepID=A0AAD7WA44_9TELE|nr:hypothetical protein AAFF_G00119210 [Aldrovandia affinis]
MVIHAHSELFLNKHFSLGQAENLKNWQGLSPSTHAAKPLLSMTVQFPNLGLPPSNGTNSTDCGEDAVPYSDLEKIVIGIVLSIITLTTIGGNFLVIISVCIVKKLRQPSNYLVVSLAAADLSVALAVMPFVIITDLVGGEWLFGKVFCNVFIAMDVMCCTASIMNLCLISVDRTAGAAHGLSDGSMTPAAAMFRICSSAAWRLARASR